MTLIIGAGLAGLVCARELHRAGAEFLLLEAESEPGGRVRSCVTPDGYTLDRGFQVLLDSYPAARRQLDIAALQPRYFDRGAIVCDAGRTWTLAHPLYHPGDLGQTLFGNVFPLSDRLRLTLLVAELLVTPDVALLAEGRSARDVSIAQFLLQRGFSTKIVERFLRPFFGGVLLENRLATSASLFRYYLKKFALGRAMVPARGMGEITRQLASRLPDGAMRLNCRIQKLEGSGHSVRAVVTESGERIACSRVVLATQAPATARLLGQPDLPTRAALGVTAVYFTSARPIYERPLLALPAGRSRLTRNFTQLSNVAPEYAPAGRCLLSASVLNQRGLDDAALAEAVRSEIAEFFPAARNLEFLAAVEVPYAQHPHPAGYARALPAAPAPTQWANAWMAGDQTTACSIQTALESGERTARFLLRGERSG